MAQSNLHGLYHIEKVLKKFPWITAHHDLEYASDARVQRLDLAVLNFRVYLSTMKGHSYTVTFHAKDGSLIMCVGIERRVPSWRNCWQKVHFLHCENVAEAILRLKRVSPSRLSEVEFVVTYGVAGTNTLVVYKLPENFRLPEWIERLKGEADREIDLMDEIAHQSETV